MNTDKAARNFAYGLAEAMDILFKEGDKQRARDFWTKYLDNVLRSSEVLEMMFYCNLPAFWYKILRTAGEMTTYIQPRGLLIEVDVAASSTYTFLLDLTPTPWVCLCPVFTCESTYGGRYSKLTIKVNVPPVDVKESEWINRYVVENLPVPVSGPPLTQGYMFVHFPKRNVLFTFINSYTDTNHMIFYTDWLRITKDRASSLIETCYKPFKEKVVERFLRFW